MNRPKEKRFLIIQVLFLVGCALNVFMALRYHVIPKGDFHQEYYASLAFLRGESIYNDWNAHPPINSLVFLPFIALSESVGFLILGLLSLASFFATLILIKRELTLSPRLTLGIATAALFSSAVYGGIASGAISFIISLLIVAAWAQLRTQRDIISGILLGLATSMKLYPAVLLLFLVFEKRWAIVTSMIGTMVVLTSFTILLLGLPDHLKYINEVMPQNTLLYSDYLANMSVPAAFQRLFGSQGGWVNPVLESPRFALWSSVIVCSALIIATALAITHSVKNASQDAAFSLTCVLMCLISPITWPHYLGTLLIPIALMFTAHPKRRLRASMGGLCFFFLCFNPLPSPLIEPLSRSLSGNLFPAVMMFLYLLPPLGLLYLWLLLFFALRNSSHDPV